MKILYFFTTSAKGALERFTKVKFYVYNVCENKIKLKNLSILSVNSSNQFNEIKELLTSKNKCLSLFFNILVSRRTGFIELSLDNVRSFIIKILQVSGTMETRRRSSP